MQLAGIRSPMIFDPHTLGPCKSFPKLSPLNCSSVTTSEVRKFNTPLDILFMRHQADNQSKPLQWRQRDILPQSFTFPIPFQGSRSKMLSDKNRGSLASQEIGYQPPYRSHAANFMRTNLSKGRNEALRPYPDLS